MMAFNLAGFNQANQMLSNNSQPPTPVKSEANTAAASAPQTELNNDTIRFLAASGPLLGSGFPGFPPGMPAPDVAAFRAAMAQNGHMHFPGIYPTLTPDFKPEMFAAAAAANGMYFDPIGYHPYAAGMDSARRKNATRETTAPLKQWLTEHHKNPYPNKAEKIMLALITKMSLTQVSTWFANARRRLKKENKMTWSPRNRPGDDDDDDLADMDAIERPSSSVSDLSDPPINGFDPTVKHGDGETNNNADKSSRSPSAANDSDLSPKKSKIWSIADTLSGKEEHQQQQPQQESPSTSAAGDKSEQSAEPGMPPQLNPFTFSFNPWAQQQMAMAMAARMPFPMLRPELLQMMSRAGGPPLVFNPALLMAAPNGFLQMERPTLSPTVSVQRTDSDKST